MKSTLKSIRNLGACGLILAVASFAAPAHADTTAPAAGTPPPPGPGGEHHGGGHMLEHLTKELSLTPDQVTKLKAIFDAQKTAGEAIRDNTSLTDEEKHTQMKALREADKPKIEAILTPDQLTKFKAMKPPGHGPGGAPGDVPAKS